MDADEGKIERYAELGVRELWLLQGRKGTWDFRAEFLSLHSGRAPRGLHASEVLEGFTPGDVYEAEAGLRLSPTLADRMAVVNRIARRRGGDSVRESAEACDRAIESMRALRREVLAGIPGIDESSTGSNADDRSGFRTDGRLH